MLPGLTRREAPCVPPGVPVVACLHYDGHASTAVFGVHGESFGGDSENGTGGVAFVGNQEVGATADDQEFFTGSVGGPDGVDNFCLGAGLNIVARGGAANGSSGQFGKQRLGHQSSLTGFVGVS